jgi:hypothetical protein
MGVSVKPAAGVPRRFFDRSAGTMQQGAGAPADGNGPANEAGAAVAADQPSGSAVKMEQVAVS